MFAMWRFLQISLLVLCVLPVFMLSSDNEVVEYTFNCDGPLSEDELYNTSCTATKNELYLECPPHHVVVATVCLGANDSDSDDCIFRSTNCHKHYEKIKDSSPSSLKNKLDSCLWKNQMCDLTANKNGWKHCYPRQHTFGYVAAFNFLCVADSTVHDVCESEEISNSSHIGYVISPDFPTSMSLKHHCNSTVLYDSQQRFEVLIQLTYMENVDVDYIVVHTLSEGGHVTDRQTWWGDNEVIRNHTTEGYGLMFEYVKSSEPQTRGFLLSYKATGIISDSFEESTPSVYTTELTDPPHTDPPLTYTYSTSQMTSGRSSGDQSSRSSLEKAGIALSVLFPIALIAALGLAVALVRARIGQPERSSHHGLDRLGMHDASPAYDQQNTYSEITDPHKTPMKN